jgi:hypothetical protein
MGISFSLFLAQLIGANEWEWELLEQRAMQNNPTDIHAIVPKSGITAIYGGRRNTQKRKSVHGRPTRRRLYKSR